MTKKDFQYRFVRIDVKYDTKIINQYHGNLYNDTISAIKNNPTILLDTYLIPHYSRLYNTDKYTLIRIKEVNEPKSLVIEVEICT